MCKYIKATVIENNKIILDKEISEAEVNFWLDENCKVIIEGREISNKHIFKIDTFVAEADSLKGISKEFDDLLNNLSIDYIERRGSNWVYYNSKNELTYLCDNTTLKNKLDLTKLYNCIEF